MRIWGKIIKENRLIRDEVIERWGSENRTTKVLSSLEELCLCFDLSVPLWLDMNIRDFQRHAKTRFTQDSFVESIDFDYLEFHVIEEDF